MSQYLQYFVSLNETQELEQVIEEISYEHPQFDKKAIEGATKGVYHSESVKNIKYGLLEKYFTYQEGQFIMDRKIREKVQFSFYDLLEDDHEEALTLKVVFE